MEENGPTPGGNIPREGVYVIHRMAEMKKEIRRWICQNVGWFSGHDSDGVYHILYRYRGWDRELYLNWIGGIRSGPEHYFQFSEFNGTEGTPGQLQNRRGQNGTDTGNRDIYGYWCLKGI